MQTPYTIAIPASDENARFCRNVTKSFLLIFSLLLLTNFLLAQNCSLVPNTLPGYIYMGEHNGSKYFCSSTNNNTWATAKAAAAAAGGHLVIINNSAENTFIKSGIMSSTVWLGYTDEATEGSFKWVNGSTATYTNWGTGEPNNTSPGGGEADYVVLQKSDGKWLDRNGSNQNEFVIEIPCPSDPCQVNNFAIVCEKRINNGAWTNLNDCFVSECPGSKVVLSVHPNGYPTTWTGPNGFTANTNDILVSNNVKLINAGVYTATVNVNGCIKSKSITLEVRDTDGDNVCNDNDCQPNNPAFPATPGSSCNDGNPNTINDKVTANGCGCAGTPTTIVTGGECVDCDASMAVKFISCQCVEISACKELSNVVIATANGVHVKYDNLSGYTGNFCSTNGTEIVKVWVKAGCFDSGDGPGYGRRFVNPLDCSVIANCGSLGGDTDGDGVCNNVDCQPTNPNLPAAPGTACNDGNSNTTNDVILADGCSCAGTVPDPCANLGGDTDGDGVCNLNDCQPTNNFYPAIPFIPCDDYNPNTVNDAVTADGCGCAGIPADPCANLGGDTDGDGVCNLNDCQPTNNFYPATPFTPCDDNNPNTVNDAVTADGCSCAGTPVQPVCDNVQMGGNIGFGPNCATSAISCNGNKPLIGDCISPIGGTGALEIIWLKATNNPQCLPPTTTAAEIMAGLDPFWRVIQGATGLSLDPGPITERTCFLRCTRRVGCVTFIESNIIFIDVDPDCGTGNTPDCDNINITTAIGSVTVSSLDGAPITSLQLFDAIFQPVFTCFGDCGATKTVDNLPAGIYYVSAKYYTAAYAQICEKFQLVTVGGCADADNDGTCDDADCQPGNPAFPATPGSTCNDGNANTDNDKVTANGCGCAGTPIDPCANLGGDTDGDGVCNQNDCQPNNSAFPATPGSPCNDGNANTNNDKVTANGCGCAGTPVGPNCALVPDNLNGLILMGTFNGSKYYCSSTNTNTWSQAKAAGVAAGLGGHLVIINDAAENEFVRSKIMASLVWIGLTDEVNEGSFKWVNGSTPSYTNWASGEPNNLSINNCTNADYAVLEKTGGKWKDRFGGDKYEFVIEIPCPSCVSATDCPGYGNPTPNCNLVPNNLPNLLLMGEYNNSKYFCSNTSDNTWTQAKAAAVAAGLGGHLVIINSAGENEFVRSKIMANNVWLGLTDEVAEGTFKWMNGAAPTYTNWASGEPNNIGLNNSANADYAVMDKSSGRWKDRIGTDKYEFVIEIPCPSSQNLQSTNVEFDFGVLKHEEHVEMIWKHNEGDNVLTYTLERSLDGMDFMAINAQDSRGGRSTELYEDYDLEPASGDNYYRLRLDLVDGRTEYSDVVTINYAVLDRITIFPNPAVSFARVSIEDFIGKKDVTITLFNSFGHQVKLFQLDEVYSKFYQMDLRDVQEGHYIVWVNIPGSRPVAKQLMVGKL